MGRVWVVVMMLCFGMLYGQIANAEDVDERLRKLEEAVEQMKQRELRERPVPEYPAGAQPGETLPDDSQTGYSSVFEGQRPMRKPGETPNLQQMSAEEQGAERKYGVNLQGSGKLIYAKPFVSNPRAILGGYFDVEYINRAHEGTPSSIDVHRFVPFIYADVSEHVKMAAELEVEHGILESSGVPHSEVSLEFATMDFLVNEKLNFRAGVVLLPVGKFNLIHDAPLRDLTERPLVTQLLSATVLSETGAGMYGTFYPSARSKLDYELYVTTGFNGYGDCQAGSAQANSLSCVTRITEKSGVAGARQRSSNISKGFDNNNGKAVVGRVAFSPFLGVEVGGSGYYGSYDPFGKRDLSMMVLDWTLVRGPFEVIGEAHWTYAQGNSQNLNGTPCTNPPTFGVAPGHFCPQRMEGYYIQGNYHFLPQWMTRLAPSFFRPEISTLTAMVRWEQVNTNKDQPDGLGDLQRLTLGVNYRPTEDTVFKFDFQYSPEAVNRYNQRIHDTAVLLSAATYF
ncbi:MAG: OprO/OprP family phosphate-selective porin [Nitrospiraceae bacterium]